MRTLILAVVLCGALAAAGCTTVDRTAAANLGQAGQTATQTLSTQAGDAKQTLSALSLWWGVGGVLNCVNVRPDLRGICIAGPPADDPAKAQAADLKKDIAKLGDAVGKRKRAVDTLSQAYAGFADLAKYNSGQDASTTLRSTFSDVNAFLEAASMLDPTAAPLPAVSTTIGKAASGGVALFADNEQNRQILKANHDLEVASGAVYAGLSREQAAMSRLLGTLGAEKEALYSSALGAGLISPVDVLSPVIVQAYPSAHVTAPPAANQEVVLAAAKLAVKTQAEASVDALAKSYEDSLNALSALSAQHEALEKTNTVTLSSIKLEIANIKSDVSSDATTKSDTKK